jgi:hypothetical protein
MQLHAPGISLLITNQVLVVRYVLCSCTITNASRYLFCTNHATYMLYLVSWSWLASAVDGQIHWTRICCLLQRQHIASKQRGHLIIKSCKYQLEQCALTTLIAATNVEHLWSSIFFKKKSKI